MITYGNRIESKKKLKVEKKYLIQSRRIVKKKKKPT